MGLISRVSSRTYRKRQKTKKITSKQAPWRKRKFRPGLSPKSISSSEMVCSRLNSMSFSSEKTRRIRELTAIVNKRWGAEQGQIDLYVERVANRGLSAVAQAESLRYKLLGGLAVRRAAYGVLRF